MEAASGCRRAALRIHALGPRRPAALKLSLLSNVATPMRAVMTSRLRHQGLDANIPPHKGSPGPARILEIRFSGRPRPRQECVKFSQRFCLRAWLSRAGIKTGRPSVALARNLTPSVVSSRGKPLVFVAMPFAEEFADRFHYGISGAVNAAGFLCERADLASFTGDVIAWVKGQNRQRGIGGGRSVECEPKRLPRGGICMGARREHCSTRRARR